MFDKKYKSLCLFLYSSGIKMLISSFYDEAGEVYADCKLRILLTTLSEIR